MAKIELSCGEAVTITFAETDGEITVGFSDEDHEIVGCDDERAAVLNDLGGIVVHADMPDSSGREGVVYHEPMYGQKKHDETVDYEPLIQRASIPPCVQEMLPKTETYVSLVEEMNLHPEGMHLDARALLKLRQLLLELKHQRLGSIVARLDPAQKLLDEIFAFRILKDA